MATKGYGQQFPGGGIKEFCRTKKMNTLVKPIPCREPEKIQEAANLSETQTKLFKRVLNAGSGSYAARSLHAVFAQDAWKEIRLDIDPQSKPDVVASITDMKSEFSPQSFDAIWSSHTLEHLYAHEVSLALAEFKRVLKPDGFALITLPDLEAVATLVLDHGLDEVAYISPAGPITPLEVIFGHSASIMRGQFYMAHKTGFTSASLGRQLADTGFATVLVKSEGLDLWALGLMQEAEQASVQDDLRSAGLDFSE
jgi:SAM-dependent methyltransferase